MRNGYDNRTEEAVAKFAIYQQYANCALRSDPDFELEFNPLRINLELDTTYYDRELNCNVYTFDVYEKLDIQRIVEEIGCKVFYSIYFDKKGSKTIKYIGFDDGTVMDHMEFDSEEILRIENYMSENHLEVNEWISTYNIE